MRAAERAEFLRRHSGTRLQLHERTRRLAPFLVRLRHHGGAQHGRVAVQRFLHLDGRNILAAADNNILGTIADFHVTVGLHDREVAGVEPAAREGFRGGVRVRQIPLHRNIAAQHDLAHGFAIPRHRLHGFGIEHRHRLLQWIPHALASVAFGALVDRQFVPGFVLGADRNRAVDLGQSIDMSQIDTDLLGALDDRGRWRGAGDLTGDSVGHAGPQRRVAVDQQRVNDGGAAHVGDAFVADGVPSGFGFHAAQADIDPGAFGDGPGEGPAVAMEHRQRPEVDRVVRHSPGQDVADRVQMGAAMVVDHALRVARCAGCVAEGNRVPLVGWVLPVIRRIALGQERFVGDRSHQVAVRPGRIVDVDHQRFFVQHRQSRFDNRRKLPVGDQNPSTAVLQHEGDGLGVEAGVQRVQHRPAHRHAEMRLVHRGRVGQHHGHGVVLADAPPRQSGRQPPAPRIGLRPGVPLRAMHDRWLVRVDISRPLDEGQRGQCGKIGLVFVEAMQISGVPGHYFLRGRTQTRSTPRGPNWAASLSAPRVRADASVQAAGPSFPVRRRYRSACHCASTGGPAGGWAG